MYIYYTISSGSAGIAWKVPSFQWHLVFDADQSLVLQGALKAEALQEHKAQLRICWDPWGPQKVKGLTWKSNA